MTEAEPSGAERLWHTRSLSLPGLGATHRGLEIHGQTLSFPRFNVLPEEVSSCNHSVVCLCASGDMCPLGMEVECAVVNLHMAGKPKRAHACKACAWG